MERIVRVDGGVVDQGQNEIEEDGPNHEGSPDGWKPKGRGMLSCTFGCRPLNVQLVALLWRDCKAMISRRKLMIAHAGVGLAIGGFLAAAFPDVGRDLGGLRSRAGAFFFALLALSIMAQTVATGKNRDKLEKDCIGSCRYSPGVHFASATLADLIFLRLPGVVLLLVVAYPSMGLEPAAERSLVFSSALTLFVAFWSIFCTATSLLSPKRTGMAQMVCTGAAIALSPFSQLLGEVSPWLSWLRFLSPFYFAWNAMMATQLRGNIFDVRAACRVGFILSLLSPNAGSFLPPRLEVG